MFSDPLTAAAANRTMKQALKPIRNQIAEAAPQLKPLANSGMPLVVALANPLSLQAPFEASMVTADMYGGEPAYTFPAGFVNLIWTHRSTAVSSGRRNTRWVRGLRWGGGDRRTVGPFKSPMAIPADGGAGRMTLGLNGKLTNDLLT